MRAETDSKKSIQGCEREEGAAAVTRISRLDRGGGTLRKPHKYVVGAVNKGTRSPYKPRVRSYTRRIIGAFDVRGRGRGRDLKPANLSSREEADRSDERDETVPGEGVARMNAAGRRMTKGRAER